jgi:hypothetical protein
MTITGFHTELTDPREREEFHTEDTEITELECKRM